MMLQLLGAARTVVSLLHGMSLVFGRLSLVSSMDQKAVFAGAFGSPSLLGVSQNVVWVGKSGDNGIFIATRTLSYNSVRFSNSRKILGNYVTHTCKALENFLRISKIVDWWGCSKRACVAFRERSNSFSHESIMRRESIKNNGEVGALLMPFVGGSVAKKLRMHTVESIHSCRIQWRHRIA